MTDPTCPECGRTSRCGEDCGWAPEPVTPEEAPTAWTRCEFCLERACFRLTTPSRADYERFACPTHVEKATRLAQLDNCADALVHTEYLPGPEPVTPEEAGATAKAAALVHAKCGTVVHWLAYPISQWQCNACDRTVQRSECMYEQEPPGEPQEAAHTCG